MALTPPQLSTTSARLSGQAPFSGGWTPWPAGAALGFPLGRVAELATASQLDLAWQAGGRGRGQPRSRYPVAPDCEIPNSVIRQLYDPKDGEPRVHFADGRRRRRLLTSFDTAERARQQQLAEAERDWLSAASLADLEAALESRRQMLEELQRQAAEAEAAAAAAAGSSRASVSQAPSRAEEANSTPTRQARQARPINLRTLPPIAGLAVAEAADGDEARLATGDATPAPAETPSAWLAAEEQPAEPPLQHKLEQQQQQQQQQQQKAAKKKHRKPIVKKTKRPVANQGKAKAGQPAKDATEEKQEGEEKKLLTEPPPPPQQQQQQQPQSILKTAPSSAGSADRQQQQQQPPTLPQVHLEQPIGRSPAASADRNRRVQFGDDSSRTGSSERSGVDSDGGAAPAKLTLLEQILAEPWFTLAESPPPEKEPVARGLLRLMKFTVNGPDHAAMCDRIRDIKSQLDLELALLQDIVDELVAQLEAILQQSKEAGVLSQQRLRLMQAKGSATLRLLEFLGYSRADRLSQRWNSVHRQLELSIQEAKAAAEAAAAAAEAAAAAKVEDDRASAAAAEAALSSSAAGTSAAEENVEDDEPVRQLFEADLMTRLKRLRSETDDTEKEDEEVDEVSTATKEPTVTIETKTTISEVEVNGEETERKASASSAKEAAAPKRPKRAASFADSGLGSSEVTSLTATDQHSTHGRAHTMTSYGDSRETTIHNNLHQLPPPQPPPLTTLSEEQQRSDSSGSGSGSGSGEAAGTNGSGSGEAAGTNGIGDGGGASRGGSSGGGFRARPITASVRTGHAGASGRGDIRIDSGSSSTGRQSQLQELPDILLIDSRLDRPGRVGGRQSMLSQHSGLYEEFIPGRDNVICSADSSSRSPTLLLAIDQRHSSATQVAPAFNAELEAKPAKRRVTILTPTAAAAMEAADPTRCQPFSFMTRSRTEPKFAASSAGGRPSCIGSRDWAKLSGLPPAQDGLLPALGDSGVERHRLAWPDHCRMDNLARRGMHRTGISISKHLDRYTLIDTVSRGLRASMQRQAELSLARSSTSLQNLSAV